MEVPYKLGILLHKWVGAGCGPVRRAGPEFRGPCPAHDDRGPSLYARVDGDRILINCSAGCPPQQVCDALDHDLSDLYIAPDEPLVELGEGLLDVQLDTGHAPEAAAGRASAPGAPAGPELRHAVYHDLLGRLELCTAHFDALRSRGLPGEEITRRGYRSADAARLRQAVDALLTQHGPEKLLSVPGFTAKGDRPSFVVSKGLLVPVRDLTGGLTAIKVRHDGPNGPKYTWASGKDASCGNPVHVPLGVPVPSKKVRLTEGELKADVATALSGVPSVSAPGVSNWHLAVPVLRQLGAERVLLAMDQDGKPGTLGATEKALYGLSREGFEVELECWDGKAAKGIDDLLAAGGVPQALTGLAAALRVRDALAPPAASRAEEAEPEPPPLPLDVFPPPLAGYLREVGESTGTPPDFAAVTLIATAGAAIGNSRALCLKPNAWYESPRFYCASVGDPASGKTPAMDAIVKPYQALQLKLLKGYKDAKAAYDKAKAEHEHAARENRALPAEERQPLPDVPAEPATPERFVAMDATIESLAPLLEQSPRGLLMPQDECVAWVKAMGQYKGGRGNDRQFWLSTWSGKAHLVDRKSQGLVPVSIPRPFINVIGGIPPDMLNELADHKGRNDGFLHRVLFTFPRVPTGTDWSDVTVSEQGKRAWADTLTSLRKLAMEELDDGVAGYRVVKMSAAAREAWVAWWNAHAAETRGPNLPAQLIGPWGKLKAYAARLALVLHYLWLVQGAGDEGDLEAVSVERAVRLIDYFKGHVRLVYGRLRLTTEDNELLEVVDWVRQQGGRCTARDLVRAKKVTPTARAKKFMTELQERGYGRLEWLEAANCRKVLWFVFDPS